MAATSLVRLLVVAVVASVGAHGTALGAIKLDNYTFDKVLQIPDHSFFVKFDQSYAYGEKEDEYKLLSKTAYNAPNFLVAEVPVQEYGDKENDDLREKFKLTKDDFPAYFLFNAANKEGLRYKGAIKATDMATWLRQQKVQMPSIGTIAELDELAQKFLKEPSDSHIEEAKKMIEESYKTDKKAQLYVKIMEKVKAKGEGYVAEETKRVTKMLEGKIAEEKKAEFNDKIKVLNSFIKTEL